MEKKVVLALLMATVLAVGAFAQLQMSAGLGGTFSAAFSTYALTDDAKDILDKDAFNSRYLGGGFFAFFDATYAMLSLGMNFYDVAPTNSDAKKAMDDEKGKQSFTSFDIELLGKFPIAVGSASIFPLLGIDIKIALAANTKVDGEKYTYKDITDESPASRLTTVWGKLGFGADIPLGNKLYLRPMFLYGIGTNTKDDKDILDDGDWVKTIVNHGLDIKVALGYKF